MYFIMFDSVFEMQKVGTTFVNYTILSVVKQGLKFPNNFLLAANAKSTISEVRSHALK